MIASPGYQPPASPLGTTPGALPSVKPAAPSVNAQRPPIAGGLGGIAGKIGSIVGAPKPQISGGTPATAGPLPLGGAGGSITGFAPRPLNPATQGTPGMPIPAGHGPGGGFQDWLASTSGNSRSDMNGDGQIDMLQPGHGMSGPAPAAAAPAQAPAQAPASSSGIPSSYANTSTFGPGGDLRSTQILPGGSGVDRFQLAQSRYKDFLDQSAPGDFDAVRMVGQRAASRGAVGSGMEARGFADTGRAIESARGSAKNTFLNDALQGTIQDQANQRAEARGERTYQAGAAQDSINNRRQQALDEETLTQGGFNRDEARIRDLMDYGSSGNPADTILAGARGAQGAADQGGTNLAELMRQYALGRSAIPPTTAAARTPQRGNTTAQGTSY